MIDEQWERRVDYHLTSQYKKKLQAYFILCCMLYCKNSKFVHLT